MIHLFIFSFFLSTYFPPLFFHCIHLFVFSLTSFFFLFSVYIVFSFFFLFTFPFCLHFTLLLSLIHYLFHSFFISLSSSISIPSLILLRHPFLWMSLFPCKPLNPINFSCYRSSSLKTIPVNLLRIILRLVHFASLIFHSFYHHESIISTLSITAAETSLTSLPKMPERSDLSALKGRSLYHGQIIRTIRRKQGSDPDSRCIAYSEPLLSHGWIEAPLMVVEAGKNKTLRLSNQQTHRSFLLLEKYSFLAFLYHVRMTNLLGGCSLQ